MYETQRQNLVEYGIESDKAEKLASVLSKKTLREAELQIGSGLHWNADYAQVISLFFKGLLSREDYVNLAIEELSNEYLSPEQIREFMEDPRGAMGQMFVINRGKDLDVETAKGIRDQVMLFKHDLLQKHFGFLEQ